MKIVLISDTHNQHKHIGELPKGDMIIHAGDISGRGWHNECETFIKWFKSLDYKYKIFIAGNHDFYFQGNSDRIIAMQMGIQVNPVEALPDSVIYLKDSMIEIEGIKIWGSPITPTFYNWAFMMDRGPQIADHWLKMPEGMDIIVSHGPPKNILDLCPDGNVGDEDLLNRLLLTRPTYFVCGHIHEAYGIYKGLYTTFINASVLDGGYYMANDPVLIEIIKNE